MKRTKRRNLSEIHRDSTQYLVEWDSKTGCSARKQRTAKIQVAGGDYGKGITGGHESKLNAKANHGTKDQKPEGVQEQRGASEGTGSKARVPRTPRAGGKGLPGKGKPKKSLKSKDKPLIPEWKPKPVTKKRRKNHA